MVLGSKGKNRRGGTVQIDCLVHIQEIKPWPPSQSLKSLRSVLIQWENGERSSGSTSPVSPGEGKIEFNESFRLHVTLLKDMSAKHSVADVFQKNYLEFNLYEPRRDKIVKGQLLGTAIVDLADCGVLKEPLSVSVPLNCKRNYRNTDQPLLYVKIEPTEKHRTRSSFKESNPKEASKDNKGGDSVSTLMNEEYAEEAESASFTDDDVSSHSSIVAATTPETSGSIPPHCAENGAHGATRNTDSNEKEHTLASETKVERLQQDTCEKLESSSNASSGDLSSNIESPANGQPAMENTSNHSPVTIQKQVVDSSSPSLEENSKSRFTNSDHENLDQEDFEEDANCRNKFEDVKTNSNGSTIDIYSRNTTSLSNGFVDMTPGSVNCISSEINDKLNELHGEANESHMKGEGSAKSYCSSVEDSNGNEMSDLDMQNHVGNESMARGVKDQVSLSSDIYYLGGSESHLKGSNIMRSERLKHVKSVRSSTESARSIGSLSSNHLSEVRESHIGDAQNNGGNIHDKRDAKIYPRESRSTIFDSKVENLENKIKMLEGELREAAAIEAALYSVVAEHGSSISKVHAPARRLSRMYLHACKENIQARRSGAAKSAVSGLALVAKACGNDVPRLTFWLSNSIVLRIIISQSTRDMAPSSPTGYSMRRKRAEGNGKIAQPLVWKGLSARKSEKTAYGAFGSWDDPNVFISALEKVEAWIFSRIVESIWWQSLTPHMQLVDAKFISRNVSSASKKSFRRMSTTCDKEQGDLSLDIWKNAFREACDRICPIRAGGHECGCLSLLPRLIMEQCVARLDVAMFNAILRESADDIPTDPVSDPIGDPKVLPIPPGKSSFGAGAQLKTAIGNWSRWLTDLFGIDDDDVLEDKDDDDHYSSDGSQNTSFKAFHLLNALSDLMMLPKDMLLNESIRKEVCPMFSAPLIKKILENFVPDEFCPDPIPPVVFEALDSQDDLEDGNESVNYYPCIAAPIAYSPPPATSIASITAEVGSESYLRRSKSSVIRKSYTSDDELDELSSPLSSILFNGSSSSPASVKPNWKLKDCRIESNVRYELLRDVWTNSE
ncbi:uncharacterized protein LOC130935746 [Arachis stenosperma]|uniref:uncharacterized protein LOC130935746 n=1 Tax=Arachis stenosperma TaxID=217475 RepID=UPI0025AC4D8E|nr:uncharacterized protein LOC130935746 [Arachis stenosperma]XP_057721615.1 uncharacterized protein LOC130935746 [Arachis stenosperma]